MAEATHALRTEAESALLGESPAMRALQARIAALDGAEGTTVLITGETGTGKGVVARIIHSRSRRQYEPFVAVDCTTIAHTLVESELFGHETGAFTGAAGQTPGRFEHADGGTIFLDEAGELPLSLQPKLLRAVEYGEVQRVGSLESRKAQVHVIAATSRDLRAEVAAGRFRSDLFYRLSILEIHLVPLRERSEDIPYLTAMFVHEFARRLKRAITGVTPAAERLLQRAPWPGNIRELRNVVERACIMAEGRILSERELVKAMSRSQPSADAAAAPAQAAPVLDPNLFATAQRDQIERVLQQVAGNKAAAARLLGMSRRSLYRWLDRLDVPQ
jgi:two-component system response regulator HydG